MGGPGAQHNKAGPRVAVKAANRAQTKAERLNTSKQQRDKKRAQLLEQRRSVGPPIVVGLLPLSSEVDAPRLWAGLLAACSEGAAAAAASAGAAAGSMEVEVAEKGISTMMPQTLSMADRRKMRFTFLPPPVNREDALAVVELGKAAEVVLLAVPGDEHAQVIDSQGQMALAVLRALGLPTVVGLVQAPTGQGHKNLLKERSAAKKHAAVAFAEQVAGDHKLMAADGLQDFKQVLRHLSDSTHNVPLWRQQRPTVMAEAAEFEAAPENPSLGTLLLRGYIRGLGLSVNQAVHIPGAGDFLLSHISGPAEPACSNEDAAAAAARQRQLGGGAGAMAVDDAGGAGQPAVLATADPGSQESLRRENVPDPLAGEQTWPTQEELMEAEEAAAQSKAGRKRRLPKGTSDYQAAWILESDDEEGDDSSDSEAEGYGAGGPGGDDESLPELEPNVGLDELRDADTGTEFGMDADDDEDEGKLAEMLRQIKERRRREEEDQQFPDELDTPTDVAARQRFAKFRGLKSFRTSPWDPKETLPQDYARVFAFENFKRTQRRAKEAAARVGAAGDPDGLPAGVYVQLHVANVPAEVAGRVLSRVAAAAKGEQPPLMVAGLLQHECKLSVVNFGVRKAASYQQPLPSKEQLLLVTGLRSFLARPVFSSDEHGADKHKMERFLHEGRPSIATVYAPICYGPLPLLAFKVDVESGKAELAATGTLRSCDPDRVVLKKIVLSGYPVRTHKAKAVVRFMFHNPDDVRWFRPVDLWTKHGRRGRIREPVGTHGAMKCIFDGPVQQRDSVCMSLYKRVYPKWPEDTSFAA
ncbi:hypothetical protein N2152v2_001785 [Parachlorella kessleri]